MVISEPASALTIGGFEYQFINDGAQVMITGYNGDGGNLIIPSNIDDKPVVVIGRGAFQYQKSITSVTIPDSVTIIEDVAFNQVDSMSTIIIGRNVTTIGNYSFYYCISLLSIVIPDKVASIGEGAFSCCSSLITVSIGSNVSIIGNGAFNGGNQLAAFSVDSNNLFFMDINGVLYNKNVTTLIRCPNLISGPFIISDSVIKICDYAFSGCELVTSLTMGDNVTIIGEGALANCFKLTSVELSGKLRTISAFTFDRCAIVQIRIPDSVIRIDNSAFNECTKLTSVIIGRNVTTIGISAFNNCNLNKISFLSLSSPTYIGTNWISGNDPSIIRGHALPESNFPAPGEFFYGLLMDKTLGVPERPTGLAAMPGFQNVTINWTAPLWDGGLSIDYYAVYLNGSENPYLTNNLFTTIDGLTNGQLCNYSVAAHNEFGFGNKSSDISMKTLDVPDSPTDLSAYVSDRKVMLSWNEPTFDGGTSIDYYIIYQDGTQIVNTVINNSVLISGLTNGQNYTFNVAARNFVGIGKISESITVIPTKTHPAPPRNIVASSFDGGISLEWIEPHDDGGFVVTSYLISRSENYGAINLLATVNSNIFQYLDNSTRPGNSYVYYLQAANQLGSSALSDGTEPTIAYSLIRLNIGCDSSVGGLGIVNTLTGQTNLVSNEEPVAGLEINLAYSVNNGIDWIALPSVVSSTEGSFNRSWIPTAEGVYLIKAMWAGNDQYPSVESIFSIAITISTQNEVFTVQSSSVISNLIFNSETKQLSFTVSGESGTSGYTRIVVSKELVANGNDIIVTLDGADMHYELSSTETSWVLYFTYSHSSHNVVADLNSEVGLLGPENVDTMLIIGVGLAAVAVVFLLVFVFYRRRGRQ